MKEIDKLLSETAHRPYPLPVGPWIIYQEWHSVLFLHWKVSFDVLRPLVPKELVLDQFDGDFYVSLVSFTIKKTRPRYLPSLKFISDFDEINVRTYVEKDGKKGVYFLSIEAGKLLSAYISKLVSGLPYEKSNIQRSDHLYKNVNPKRNNHLDVEFYTKEQQARKTSLDKWLTERYCLFLDQGKNIYRYDVHHHEWEIKKVELKHLDLNYKIGDLKLTGSPDILHYSEGLKVLIWFKVLERKYIDVLRF